MVALPALVAAVRAVTTLPVIAAGGVADASDVTAALQAGAESVMVGTVLLLSDESGASTVHRAAIAGAEHAQTVVTRAFTGRPARALPNEFIARHDATAPLGYPALHHLTSGLRRAGAAAGNPAAVNLWAGTGYGGARAESTAAVLSRLAARS
jgi:nitronate monooxygenase